MQMLIAVDGAHRARTVVGYYRYGVYLVVKVVQYHMYLGAVNASNHYTCHASLGVIV